MTYVAQFILAHGAALLFVWILLQQAGVPIPSTPLLIAVGSLASYGPLSLLPSLWRQLWPLASWQMDSGTYWDGGVGQRVVGFAVRTELEKSCVESHSAPFGCGHFISKVRGWFECRFATGRSSRFICSTVSHL
jgi:hypothetical protein